MAEIRGLQDWVFSNFWPFCPKTTPLLRPTMRSPQLVIVGSAFILCALLSHSFLGESVEQGPSEHAQHLRDVVQEKVAEHPQGNNNANSNANANTNNPPPAVHHPSPAPMALLQPQGSGAYEAAGGDDTPKIPPSASVGSAPILTWADFTAKIGCGNGIRAPLTSAQGGSEVVISDVLKLSECHVNNMEEPPFYKSDVTNGLVIDVGANDGVDYAGPGARKGHLVYSFEVRWSVVVCACCFLISHFKFLSLSPAAAIRGHCFEIR